MNTRDSIRRVAGLAGVALTAFVGAGLALENPQGAGPEERKVPRERPEEHPEQRNVAEESGRDAVLDRLQQDLASQSLAPGGAGGDGGGGAPNLPGPPVMSPTADELRNMTREERVRALEARTWEIYAAPVPDGIDVDGSLDEAAWEQAIPIGDFYERETREGLPSTESTIVRILYDDENLYFGFYCTLENAEANRPRTMFRDENIGSDDAVAILLDAYNDQRSAVFLATNANGILFDMSQNGQNERTRNLDWDMVWEARGRTFPWGWTSEVRVPFKSLRFRPSEPGEPVVFGVGFKRNIPQKKEEVYWPFVSNDSTWYRPAELGKLRGMTGIQPGRNLEIRPFAAGGLDGGGEWEGEGQRFDGGLDMKWGVTPGLTADFTWNTDFAQEEVDDLQLNFTRFSLRFPEKRQIFLEGQRNFTFGERRDADVVFTRRIGLSDAGQPVPIVGGARLSGRQGAYTLGLMEMVTAEHQGAPGESFTVARVRRDVSTRSSVGAVFTDRSAVGTDAFNRVIGFDTSLYAGDAWSFEGLWSRVSTGAELDSSDLASGRIDYETDLLQGTAKYIEIGENFDPGIGFVQRRGMRKTYFRAGVSPRPSAPWMRQVHFQANVATVWNLDNVLETRRGTLQGRATFESGDEVSVEVTDQYEFTLADYSIQDVVIPAGEYPFRRYQVSLNTYRRRYAGLQTSYEFGGFWGGTRDTWSLGANYRVNRNIGLRGNYAYNRVRLPGGDIDTHLISTRMRVALRNDLVVLGLFQYNNATADFASNVRFNWIPKPGTDLFLVYTELDEWSGDLFFVRNRSLSVKLNYLFRL